MFQDFFRMKNSGKQTLSAEEKAKMKMTVNKAACPQNHPCPSVRVCPVGAIHQKGYNAPTIDEDTCIKCGKCIRYCPFGAFSME